MLYHPSQSVVQILQETLPVTLVTPCHYSVRSPSANIILRRYRHSLLPTIHWHAYALLLYNVTINLLVPHFLLLSSYCIAHLLCNSYGTPSTSTYHLPPPPYPTYPVFLIAYPLRLSCILSCLPTQLLSLIPCHIHQNYVFLLQLQPLGCLVLGVQPGTGPEPGQSCLKGWQLAHGGCVGGVVSLVPPLTTIVG